MAEQQAAADVVFSFEVMDEDIPTRNGSPNEISHGRLSNLWKALRHVEQMIEDKAMRECCHQGLTKHLFPLCLSIVASSFTFAASWDCSYFKGATISFTGGKYGLWTLEDSNGNCQLWDVLFFSYGLGPHLIAARAFSMIAMLLGLSLTTTLAQASQFHLAGWGIGVAIPVFFWISLSTVHRFNVWCIFWFCTYVLIVLIVRSLFVHPVARRITKRGCRIIAGFFIVCAMFCLLTMTALKSPFCTCSGLTDKQLAGRDPGDPCDGTCTLHRAGYFMIAAASCYLGSALVTVIIGIQPDNLNTRNPEDWYSNFLRGSITSRVISTLSSSFHGDVRTKLNTEQPPRNENQTESSCSHGASTSWVTINSPNLNDNLDHKSQMDFSDEDERTKYVLSSEENLATGVNQDIRRTFRQKFCCDYRIKPRTRQDKVLFCMFRSLIALAFLVYFLIIAVMVGSYVENTRAQKSPDTTPYFTLDEVCAFNPQNPYEEFKSFPNREAAHADNWIVAHCGECGNCSNPHDIMVYVSTRKTIAKTAESCWPERYFEGYNGLTRCLEEKIRFTSVCTTCWANNMISTGSKCLFTCLEAKLDGFMSSNNVQGAGDAGWMNQCLFCDERISGPDFVTCSGVARRRLGITSEIDRNSVEQCQNMDISWDAVDFETIGFRK